MQHRRRPDIGDEDYSIGPCTRIQMSVSFGTLEVGSLAEVFKDKPNGDASTDQVDSGLPHGVQRRVDLATDAGATTPTTASPSSISTAPSNS